MSRVWADKAAANVGMRSMPRHISSQTRGESNNTVSLYESTETSNVQAKAFRHCYHLAPTFDFSLSTGS